MFALLNLRKFCDLHVVWKNTKFLTITDLQKKLRNVCNCPVRKKRLLEKNICATIVSNTVQYT